MCLRLNVRYSSAHLFPPGSEPLWRAVFISARSFGLWLFGSRTSIDGILLEHTSNLTSTKHCSGLDAVSTLNRTLIKDRQYMWMTPVRKSNFESYIYERFGIRVQCWYRKLPQLEWLRLNGKGMSSKNQASVRRDFPMKKNSSWFTFAWK